MSVIPCYHYRSSNTKVPRSKKKGRACPRSQISISALQHNEMDTVSFNFISIITVSTIYVYNFLNFSTSQTIYMYSSEFIQLLTSWLNLKNVLIVASWIGGKQCLLYITKRYFSNIRCHRQHVFHITVPWILLSEINGLQ